ncbi:MurR/RpiR family transcriptional regulator [Nocardioides limicola]|uniref:MurR/RpiR family transcriptional regulator n=1 Tax=Nocardioides limicola TaxID=2803368 RepID=UPI00193AEB59|nr:MurR/RpiR family transcriptional regulator [Nocardioides sp. DJM-14]
MEGAAGVAGGPVLPTIRASLPGLHPGEQRVCQVISDRAEWVIESTTAELAEAAGVSAATVVRTAQRLGYRGFPHLKVLLARDLGVSTPVSPGGSSAAPVMVHDYFGQIAAALPQMAALLSDEALTQAVALISEADRVLVAGNGVSSTVAQDLALRLTSVGRLAEAPSDSMDQVIRARLLCPDDVLVVVSGTGATAVTLHVAEAARAAGAPVITLTGFTRAPLSRLATVELVVGGGELGLREELRVPFRIPQLILANALVAAVAAAAPGRAAQAHDLILEVIAEELHQH